MEHLNIERGLTLSKLTATSSRKIVENIIHEQLKMIDAKILTAHNAGFNQVEHELPINFGVNNLAKSDAQIMIYSEIITIMTTPEEMGGKGFDNVWIDISPSGLKASLHIKWMNGMDDEEKQQRRAIIRQRSLHKK
jgi:hypothetical protein